MAENGTVDVALTQEQQVMVSAVVTAIKDELKHECFFDVKARKDIHQLVDAIQSEGADFETHVYVIRVGKNIKRFIEKAGTGVIWMVLVSVFVVILHASGVKINPFKWFAP